MVVSVIVTTKNEERHIGSCLESVKKQTYPRELIETIVVDNNSSDKTKEITLGYTDKVYNRARNAAPSAILGSSRLQGNISFILIRI